MSDDSEPALGNECAHPTGPCPGQFCSCGCRKCRPDLYPIKETSVQS